MRPEPNPAPVDERILSALESVLLAAGEQVSVVALAEALDVSRATVVEGLRLLSRRLGGGIRLQRQADAARLVTAPENAAAVQRFLGVARPPALSRAALEALTVVAYRQPVTRPEVEAMRGVNSDRALHTLLARGLIEETGRRPGPGRPPEYGTTFAFLEYFGLGSLADLPSLPAEEGAEQPALGLRAAEEHEGGRDFPQPPPVTRC